MAQDFGDELRIRLRKDSTASKGAASRIGLGKVRHLDAALLWMQHQVGKGKIQIHKVGGKLKLADIGTKDVEEALIVRFMGGMGFKEEVGRHPKALKVLHGLGGYGGGGPSS
eukprot:1165123-Pyramimonas_sp.AAC.1